MIKKALLNRKGKKLSRRRTNENLSYGKAGSIGILYNSEEFEKKLINELLDSFSVDGKETSTMAYSELESYDKYSFCNKDVSVTGELKKKPVGLFTNRMFDFLISLDSSGDINFRYVLALSKATCKVGINSEALNDLLMLSIKKSSDKSQDIREIIRYLKMMK